MVVSVSVVVKVSVSVSKKPVSVAVTSIVSVEEALTVTVVDPVTMRVVVVRGPLPVGGVVDLIYFGKQLSSKKSN